MTDREYIKTQYLTNTMFATRYTFKMYYGRKFVIGQHHVSIGDVLDEVFAGKIKRLLINLPPRYSKTEEAVKVFVSKGLAINPKSKFIHLSYSSSLAEDNSEAIKDIVTSDFYQELFPYVRIKKDSKGKKKWYTTKGGGVYVTGTGGQITGFGAGEVEDAEKRKEEEELNKELEEFFEQIGNLTEFAGAIVIDDSIKPEDAQSAIIRDKINLRFETTIRSRINSRNTPIIVIGQRLHKNDLPGYLIELEGRVEDGGEWTVLSLPAIYTDENGEEQALWPFKQTLEELYKLRKANKYVFQGQYMQDPVDLSGERLWCFAFDKDRHTQKGLELDPNIPVIQSWDFNRNPIACSIWQFPNGQPRCLESIEVDNATVKMMCDVIEKKYPSVFFWLVTGDVNGKTKTAISHLDSFTIIKNHFQLSRNQMQYSGSNPGLADSRYFINSIFEEYPILLDADKCKELIFDLENVKADNDNKPVKESRTKKEQRADHLDNMRYALHRYYKEYSL